MNLFRNTTIRDRVMAVVNQKIDAAQERYEEESVEIDRQAEVDKESLADRLARQILS